MTGVQTCALPIWVTYQGYLGEGTFLFIKARCQPRQWKKDELELKITSIELLPDVKDELVEKITISIPLSALDSTLIMELSALIKSKPGITELYFKIIDETMNHQYLSFLARPIKLSVGKDLINYLNSRSELDYIIN